MNEQEFYDRVANLLGTTHEYRERTPVRASPLRDGVTYKNTYKTRYNGRIPGNGRFSGHGIIRDFGATIFVNLTNPKISGTFKTYDEALNAIVAAEVAKNDAAVTDNPVGYRLLTEGEQAETRARTAEAHEKIKAVLEERKRKPPYHWHAHRVDGRYEFEDIYPSLMQVRLCGNEKVVGISIDIEPDEANWDRTEPYWGWLEPTGELSMVQNSYKTLGICFPYGIEAAIEHDGGKPVKLVIKAR